MSLSLFSVEIRRDMHVCLWYEILFESRLHVVFFGIKILWDYLFLIKEVLKIGKIKINLMFIRVFMWIMLFWRWKIIFFYIFNTDCRNMISFGRFLIWINFYFELFWLSVIKLKFLKVMKTLHLFCCSKYFWKQSDLWI